jgi:hypothetical protein
VDYETEIDEAQILADWKRAHETGVCKADFAKQLGKPFKDLVRLLNRTMRRIARENKRCGQRR